MIYVCLITKQQRVRWAFVKKTYYASRAFAITVNRRLQ